MVWYKGYKTLKRIFYKFFGNPRQYKKDLNIFHNCKKILDIGCGKGYFAETDKKRIVGIDINPENIKICREKNIEAYIADALFLPFKENSFDGVHCAHVIEHLNYREACKLASEITRVLKSKGFLVIRTPMPNKFFFNDPTHVRPYPPAALLTIFGLTEEIQLSNYIKREYEFVDLFFSRRYLFQPDIEVGVKPQKYPVKVFLKGLGLFIGKFGIKHWEKSEYILVLKKI